MSFEACQNVTFKKFEVDTCIKEVCPPQFTTQEVCVDYDEEPTSYQAQKDIYVKAEKIKNEFGYKSVDGYNGEVEITQSFFSKLFGILGSEEKPETQQPKEITSPHGIKQLGGCTQYESGTVYCPKE